MLSRMFSLSKTLFILLSVGTLLTACGGGGGGSDGSQASSSRSSAETGTITGWVTNAADGTALSGAVVSAAGVTTNSAADGTFTLTGVAVGNRIVVQSVMDGYANNFEVAAVTRNSTTSVRIQQIPFGVVSTVPATTGGTVTVPNSAAQVVLGANTLISANGSLYTGDVTVYVTPIDPAVLVSVMPGDFTAANGSGTSDIESFGAVSVELRDAVGQPLNLAEGQSATIRIPVATRSSARPATIPLFYFNEGTGVWVQEGSAVLDAVNGFYEGTVSRIAVWNADQIVDSVFFNGCVVDANNMPLGNALIMTDGISYSGTSATYSNASGQFSVRMKLNGTAAIVGQLGTLITNTISAGPAAADFSNPVCLVMSAENAAFSIKLTWGDVPVDLDSHLITPSGDHVYFVSQGSLSSEPYVNLDVDDLSSFGPEVVTATKLMVGTYTYYVDNYSGEFPPGISGSPAHVELTFGGTTMAFSPTSGENGATPIWSVFSLTVSPDCSISVHQVNTWESTPPVIVSSTPVYCSQ